MDAFLHQTLSPAAQSLFRCGYGVLLLLTLAQALPQARRFFVSERWGGYARSERRVDLVQNRYLLPVVMGLWVACAALLIVGRWTVMAAIEEAVSADVISAALFTRFRSRREHTFAEKLLSAMRKQFGGHVEPPSGGETHG